LFGRERRIQLQMLKETWRTDILEFSFCCEDRLFDGRDLGKAEIWSECGEMRTARSAGATGLLGKILEGVLASRLLAKRWIFLSPTTRN
jgi:hypothetical protein